MILGLISVIVSLLVILWFQHREQGKIAKSFVDILLERLRTADKERESLLTRVQGYDPRPMDETHPTPRAPRLDASSPADHEEAPSEEDEMGKRGLRPNTDGGYLDEWGHLFIDFVAYDEWIRNRDMNRLPRDANPKDHVRAG
jgi:hypothetical protein